MTDTVNPITAIPSEDTIAVASKYKAKTARNYATEAAAKRVSRRILLAIRSRQLTVVCPETGIVSLLDIPSIPKNTMVWTSPFASLSNCRGIAQQGLEYLRKLDTQVLAGVLVMIASPYELFRFAPSDTGAQKNALLRTAGKDLLIDAIIIVEDQVHSGNASYLPKLSLVQDVSAIPVSMEVRMHNYLKLLAERIATPDTAPEKVDYRPMHPIKPAYQKDADKKVSFMQKMQKDILSTAKKTLAADIKLAKQSINALCKECMVSPKLKGLLESIFVGEVILVTPVDLLGLIATKLKDFNHPASVALQGILTKPRTGLRAEDIDLDELATPVQKEESRFVDLPIGSTVSTPASPAPVVEMPVFTPPEGLTALEQIRWKTKAKNAWLATQPAKPSNVAPVKPIKTIITPVYVPTAEKTKLASAVIRKRMITDDFGDSVLVVITSSIKEFQGEH